MVERSGTLSEHIIRFCRYLRKNGYSVGTTEEMLILRALPLTELKTAENFHHSLKALCCHHTNEWDQFDEYFNKYWNEYAAAVDSKIIENVTDPVRKKNKVSPFKSIRSFIAEKKDTGLEETASYSAGTQLGLKDFSDVTDEELRDLLVLLKALSKRLAARLKRRYEKSIRQGIPDLGKTLRRNLKFGGEIMQVIYRQPLRSRTKLIVLCDVSRSMELYAGFLLQFMYAFQQVYRRIHIFSFGTELQRLDPHLKNRNFFQAMEALSGQNQSWYGGTRIGFCFQDFLEDYGKLLDRNTTVLILSDGWDQGDPELIGGSMKEIRQKVRKIIWLNPLAGFPGYRPETAGMKAALPFIDIFLPAHNARSLRELFKWI